LAAEAEAEVKVVAVMALAEAEVLAMLTICQSLREQATLLLLLVTA
jgi:hypothetical protein